MTDPTPAAGIARIPLAHSVRYVARGLPDLPFQYGRGIIRPAEIVLTYRSAPDSQLGRVHAYVTGHLWVDGHEASMGEGYGQHYDDGMPNWPAWLTEEARLHDPDTAATVPASAPTDWIDGHPQLEAIAAAVWEKCGRSDSGLVVDDPRNIAVAALAAVLPAPAACSDPIECSHEAALGELAELRSRLADYENRITWETTCGSCARVLDSSIRETERAEKAEAAVERVRSYLASQTGSFPANYPVAVPAADVLANLDAVSGPGRADDKTQQARTLGEIIAAKRREPAFVQLAETLSSEGGLLDVPQQPECSASLSGGCLRESESETACDTESGECVHGGKPGGEAQQDDDEGLRAKVDDATSTLRRVRTALRTLKEQGATGQTYNQVIANALSGPRPDDVPEPETEEQIVREHVTTVHLIGEQLADVESWLWKRLAEVRAEQPAAVSQPDGEA